VAELEPVYWLVIAALVIALAIALGALVGARRRARRAQAEAAQLRGMAGDPVGARLMRLDMEIDALGNGRTR